MLMDHGSWTSTNPPKNPHHHSHHYKGVASLHQGVVVAIPKGVETQGVCTIALSALVV